MPYTSAVLMEVQRFRPVAVLVPPHGVFEDTQLAGYNIPKVLIFCNIIMELSLPIPLLPLCNKQNKVTPFCLPYAVRVKRITMGLMVQKQSCTTLLIIVTPVGKIVICTWLFIYGSTDSCSRQVSSLQ